MLILKLKDKNKEIKKTRNIFRRRKVTENEISFNRYSINVNGKNVLVLELNESELSCDEVITLLKIYKDRVLVAKENKNNNILKEYMFKPKEYYKRAVLSSLIKQIRTVNKDWKYLSVKMDVFSPYKELYEIVKISKTVNLITQKNAKTLKFVNECYNEYGAIVNIIGAGLKENEVYLDLEQIDDSGKLMISVKGKEFLLYPDATFFQPDEEYKKLLPYGLEHNVICAAFSNK